MNNYNFTEYGYSDDIPLIPKHYSVSISNEDNVIKIMSDGSLLAMLSLKANNGNLELWGKSDTNPISSIAFPYLKSITKPSYDNETHEISMDVVMTDGTITPLSIDIEDLLKIYEGGDGIVIDDNNKISIKIKEDSTDILSASSEGLSISMEPYAKTDDVNAAISAISGTIETQIEGISTFDAFISSKFDELSAKTDSEIEILNNEDEAISANTVFNKTLIDEISGSVSSLTETVEKIISPSEDLSKRIDEVSGKTDSNKELIDELTIELKDFSADTYSFEDKINLFSGDVLTFSSKTESSILQTNANVSNLDTLINSNSQLIVAEENRAKLSENAISANVSELSGKLEEDKILILSNSDNIGKISAFSEDNLSKINELSASTHNLSREVIEDEAKILANTNNITSINTNIDTINTNLSKKIEDVHIVQDTANTLHYSVIVDGNVKGEINIPKDNFLKSASYDPSTNKLELVFITTEGETTSLIDLSDLENIYNAGTGIYLTAANEFGLKIPSDEYKITADSEGVRMKSKFVVVKDWKCAFQSIDGHYNPDTEVIDFTTSAANALTDINAEIDSQITTVNKKIDDTNSSVTALGKEIIGTSEDETTSNTIYGSKKYADYVANSALTESKKYTLSEYEILDSKFSNYVSNDNLTTELDKRQNEIINLSVTSAETYTDGKTTEVLNSANTYTDKRYDTLDGALSVNSTKLSKLSDGLDDNPYTGGTKTKIVDHLWSLMHGILGTDVSSTSESDIKPITAITSDLNSLKTKVDGMSAIDVSRFSGHNSISTLTSIPTDKCVCIATISSDQTITLSGNTLTDGMELNLVINNTDTSSHVMTIPDSIGSFLCVKFNGDTITVKAGGYAEMNMISDGTKIYIRNA